MAAQDGKTRESTSKRVIETMKEVTGASEEDIKVMLQLCG